MLLTGICLSQTLSLCLLCVLLQGACPSWSTTSTPSPGLTWSLLTPFRSSQTVGSHVTCPTWMASPTPHRGPLCDLGPGAALEPGSRHGGAVPTALVHTPERRGTVGVARAH